MFVQWRGDANLPHRTGKQRNQDRALFLCEMRKLLQDTANLLASSESENTMGNKREDRTKDAGWIVGGEGPTIDQGFKLDTTKAQISGNFVFVPAIRTEDDATEMLGPSLMRDAVKHWFSMQEVERRLGLHLPDIIKINIGPDK